MSIELSLYIEKRILNLLLFALELKRQLPESSDNFILSNQIVRIIRRLESIYEMARQVGEGEEFVSVMVEAQKEARETKYWIRVLKESNAQLRIISELEDESEELIKIFSRIISM
ncbi:MAG: hypothetical protein A2958_01835 [Candidatus Levybacteria bacterium RIFCSPLOWO2_01_FULL_38_13]|nr:MAG: hypothetical protein A2629_02590 [Candidatus Levybacteria bacterium RIFCSPHIGHO2_01_FULL_41_15]OGH35699.1 MAG: hypothetical protein A2958_01835 [Candidatus Levybacteria bacterium RIFCSPLOWO2_01_FULL_38_13]